jgi:ABC-type sugar transport system permease subunit
MHKYFVIAIFAHFKNYPICKKLTTAENTRTCSTVIKWVISFLFAKDSYDFLMAYAAAMFILFLNGCCSLVVVLSLSKR